MASSMASMAAAIHTSGIATPATTVVTGSTISPSTGSVSGETGYGNVSQQQQQQQQLASSSSLLEVADSAQEIKTEFYTREGLWTLVRNTGEYARQVVIGQQQQFQPQPQLQQGCPVTTGLAGSTQNMQQNGSSANLNGY